MIDLRCPFWQWQVVTFSILFLNVMSPLNEIHRFIDETHECSLKVGDLLELLDRPEDRSFSPENPREPHLELGEPILMAEHLCLDYLAADGTRRRSLDNLTLTIQHGETIGIAGQSGCGFS